VHIVVDGDAADVHAYARRLQRDERLLLAPEAVVDLQRFDCGPARVSLESRLFRRALKI
jgi:hypothetical protein